MNAIAREFKDNDEVSEFGILPFVMNSLLPIGSLLFQGSESSPFGICFVGIFSDFCCGIFHLKRES